jgi:ABC-type bacteriocin/lantibiotic exporter with double-glycine peptidase domain
MARLGRGVAVLALATLALSAPNLRHGGAAFSAARETYRLASRDVVLQSHPRGCGAALLATLLRRRGLPSSEAALLDAAPPGAEGITLASFADLAARHGLRGTWRRAADLPAPGFVAHLDRPDGHYVWVADRAGEYLRVVDPSEGEALWHVDRLARRWSGRYLRLEPTS